MKSVAKIIRVTFVLFVLVCIPVSAELKKRGLATGVWGGQHISFEVSGKGATIEYDCAHATIDRTIFLDRNGRFSVSGRHFSEHAGPVREQDERQTGYPVTFSGEVKGNELTLKVHNSSTKEDLGTFTLVHGAEPKLFKCK
jgi:hypothetical protein